jgi:hypothetical protein
MPMIDFRKVRKLVTLEDVLILLGHPFRSRSVSRAYGPCPLGCCDRRRCCSFNLERSLWCCHRCGLGGSALDLWAAAKTTTIYAAAAELCQIKGVRLPLLDSWGNPNHPQLPARRKH